MACDRLKYPLKLFYCYNKQRSQQLQTQSSTKNNSFKSCSLYLETDETIFKGKITVLNNSAFAPLIYASSVAYTPNKAITEVSNIIQKIVWEDRLLRFLKKTTHSINRKRGLTTLYFETKVKSLQLSWVKDVHNNMYLGKYFLNTFINVKMWHAILHYTL